MNASDSFPASLFIGTWHLIAYHAEEGGVISHPFGPDASGLLVYTADGYMTGQVMRSGRLLLPSGYRKGGAPDIVLAAFDGYIAYWGRWQVDPDAGEIIHHVEGSLYPNWAGTEQRRKYYFEGDQLSLTAEMRRPGGSVSLHLIWARERA